MNYCSPLPPGWTGSATETHAESHVDDVDKSIDLSMLQSRSDAESCGSSWTDDNFDAYPSEYDNPSYPGESGGPYATNYDRTSPGDLGRDSCNADTLRVAVKMIVNAPCGQVFIPAQTLTLGVCMQNYESLPIGLGATDLEPLGGTCEEVTLEIEGRVYLDGEELFSTPVEFEPGDNLVQIFDKIELISAT